jgi:hypothetical protein
VPTQRRSVIITRPPGAIVQEAGAEEPQAAEHAEDTPDTPRITPGGDALASEIRRGLPGALPARLADFPPERFLARLESAEELMPPNQEGHNRCLRMRLAKEEGEESGRAFLMYAGPHGKIIGQRTEDMVMASNADTPYCLFELHGPERN